MKGKFYHIYLTPNKGVENATVLKQMDKALDWFMYDSNVWIVYSTTDIQSWHDRLQPLAGASGCFFVCEINLAERTGWMSKKFWEWVSKDRSK